MHGLLGILLLVGWVINLIHVIGEIGNEVTTMFVLHALGIIAFPFGGILGWITVFS